IGGARVGAASTSRAASPSRVAASKAGSTSICATPSTWPEPGCVQSSAPVTTRSEPAAAVVPLERSTTQCAAVSTSIGETTVPEHAVLSPTSATNAIHGQLPAAAGEPPTTAGAGGAAA